MNTPQPIAVSDQPYSVLLLYPDTLAENYGEETYFAHVWAATPQKAVEKAKTEANAANHFNVLDPDHTEDFRLLLCIRGHVTPEKEG